MPHQASSESARPSGSITLRPAPQVRGRDLRERTATELARYLVFILAGTVISIFVFAFWETSEDAMEMAKVILPLITTLVGSVLGYYFGGRDR